ncbi:MAG: hypothetical protein N3B13_01945 [Deltaproteobacteria bacterium]|nr:hypothetical protein [Deltaproteobacteria bacterium]
MRILITTLTLLILSFFYACGSTTLIEEADGSQQLSDIHSGPDSGDEIFPDAAEELSDAIPDTFIPEKCDRSEACNNYLKEDNLCDGTCIFQEHRMTCDGNIFNNLCYLYELPQEPIQPKIIDGIQITPPSVPLYVTEGDRLEISLILANNGRSRKELTYSYKNPDNWEIFPKNFERSGILSFEPNETKTLRFNANAIKSNMFNTNYSPVITFYFNDVNYEIYSWISFYPKQDYIQCNNSYYPPNYCMSEDCSGYANYNSAVCCDNIFYPGSNCCKDADCRESVCIDGKCVYQVPGIFIANTTFIQNNRILVILSDFDEFEEKDLCKDKYGKQGYDISTSKIEEYFNKIIYNRTKRNNILNFKWEILAGFRSEKFIRDNKYDFQSFREGLQKYITELGCDIKFEEYDKLIIISPRMDLYGYGGMAFGLGYIGQVTFYNYLLTAHELAHSFGASDLYLDIGGNFQYALSIMSTNLGITEFPDDKVMWGETGLGDTNNNGIIDLFEFAVFPEKIVINNLKATLTNKESVEISFEPLLVENGIPKKGIFYSYYIELPEHNAVREIYGTPITAFDQYEVNLNKIRETKRLKIRLKLSYRYSDKEFKNRILTFDNTFDVNVDEIRE